MNGGIMKFQHLAVGFWLIFSALFAQAALLISQKEAALPAAESVLPTRGISRGPSIKMANPGNDISVSSPFDFRVTFEPRGDSKVEVDSIKVVYMKSPFVDLTPRLKSAISANGIDFAKADVPPGTHTIRVSVKDTDGRETNSVLTLVVNK